MKKNKSCDELRCRLGKVGGQAVIEGVMMKAGNRTTTTCRKDDGSLVVTDGRVKSIKDKYKILGLPFIRGAVNFIESMVLSVKTMSISADALGLEEEEPTKFEKWLKEKLNVDITTFIMVISVVLGLGLSVLLFTFLPIWITAGINALLGIWSMSMPPLLSSFVEGIVKMAIFIGYLFGVSFMKDIKRTFMYHGAEHKSIACFEAGEELTPENAKKYTRFHPRCGTSFMLFMILLGIFAGFIIKSIIPNLDTWLYTLIRILILPVLMGVGYEFIRFAGKHDNIITRILSAPGLWVQRITTKEPTEDMLEVAITSLKCALRDDYPEFGEFYEARPWEKNEEKSCSLEQTESEGAEAAAEEFTEEASIENSVMTEKEATEENDA